VLNHGTNGRVVVADLQRGCGDDHVCLLVHAGVLRTSSTDDELFVAIEISS
jgi:hypothetical protein